VIAWSDRSNNETGFIVERLELGSSWTRVGYRPVNASTFTDNSVQTGKAYEYRVSAYNDAGQSGYSNTVSGVTASLTRGSPTLSAPAQAFTAPSLSSSRGSQD
jgi:titin